jgi:hypothetical protein
MIACYCLSQSFGTMTVATKKLMASCPFDMSFFFPYLMYSYIEDNHQRVTVDFLVHGMAKETFCPKVVDSGRCLQFDVVVPSFYVDENQLQIAYEDDESFNENTNKATAFKEIAAAITNNLADEEPLFGEPQKVKVPFPCKDEVVNWELQIFENDDKSFMDDIMGGTNQYFFVLTVELQSALRVKNSKKKGALHLLGSPNRKFVEPEEEEDDSKMEDSDE